MRGAQLGYRLHPTAPARWRLSRDRCETPPVAAPSRSSGGRGARRDAVPDPQPRGRALCPAARPVTFSTGHRSPVESHLESRLSDSVGRAWRPHRAQALLRTVCLAGGI